MTRLITIYFVIVAVITALFGVSIYFNPASVLAPGTTVTPEIATLGTFIAIRNIALGLIMLATVLWWRTAQALAALFLVRGLTDLLDAVLILLPFGVIGFGIFALVTTILTALAAFVLLREDKTATQTT